MAIGLTGLTSSSSATSSRSPLASVPSGEASDDEASDTRLAPMVWSERPVASSEVVATRITVSAARPIKHAIASQTVLIMAVPSLKRLTLVEFYGPVNHVPERGMVNFLRAGNALGS